MALGVGKLSLFGAAKRPSVKVALLAELRAPTWRTPLQSFCICIFRSKEAAKKGDDSKGGDEETTGRGA
jgi:hypothetical protein